MIHLAAAKIFEKMYDDLCWPTVPLSLHNHPSHENDPADRSLLFQARFQRTQSMTPMGLIFTS